MVYLEIPLKQMEDLEQQYGVQLHINQYKDADKEDEFYMRKNRKEEWLFVGNTIFEVTNHLKSLFNK